VPAKPVPFVVVTATPADDQSVRAKGDGGARSAIRPRLADEPQGDLVTRQDGAGQYQA